MNSTAMKHQKTKNDVQSPQQENQHSKNKAVVAENITLSYGAVTVLQDAWLEVHDGEIVGLFGENGTGKTTFLRAILGLIPIQQGKLYVFGKDVQKKYFKLMRTRLGYVNQKPINSQFPVTVKEAVAMGRYGKIGIGRGLSADDWEIVHNALHQVDMSHLAHRNLHQLSGGQAQRVSIARAIAQEPRLLLLDEPTASLDKESQFELIENIQSLNQHRGITIILVSHNPQMANFCDRIYHFDNGKIKKDFHHRATKDAERY